MESNFGDAGWGIWPHQSAVEMTSKSRAGGQSEANIDRIVESLRADILQYLSESGMIASSESSGGKENSKERIRELHSDQRRSRGRQELGFLRRVGKKPLKWFASGNEIRAERIKPELVPVAAGSEMGDLFRFASLLWSVPVSRGFGRRLRYVLIDRQNYKLMGLMALGDPVFNLKVRDKWIGWNSNDRKDRLVNVMDAYVLGAVPPYSRLIVGKLVAALVASQEVVELFQEKYGDRRGLISHNKKNAQLALVTTTSALGRSSIYNRLQIPHQIRYSRLGTTSGYGHFQFPEEIFGEIRQILQMEGHKYATGYHFGDGPNWRFRVVRAGLKRLGLDPEMLRHGIKREVYGVTIARNWREYLNGSDREPIIDQPTVDEIAEYCISRWILPRSERMPEYHDWKRSSTWEQVIDNCGFKPSDLTTRS